MTWERISAETLGATLVEISQELETKLDLLDLTERQATALRLEEVKTAPLKEKAIRVASVCQDLAEHLARTDPQDGVRYYNLSGEILLAAEPSRFPNQIRRAVLGFLDLWMSLQIQSRSAEDVLEDVSGLLNRLFGTPPVDVRLAAHALMIDAFEKQRQTIGDDSETLRVFIGENYRVIKDLEVPADRERIKQIWREDCEHHSPHIFRIMEAASPQVVSLDMILSEHIRRRLEEAIDSNDSSKLFSALLPVQQELVKALRERLEFPSALNEPAKTPKLGGPKGADVPEFVQAQKLLREGKKIALEQFRNLRWRVSTNAVLQAIVLQWYAYTLVQLGSRADKLDAKLLLRDVKNRDWTTEWNAACLEYLTEDREAAFEILRQMLKAQYYEPKVFEAALHLALALNKTDWLLEYLPRSWHPEAIPILFLLEFNRNQDGDFEESLVRVKKMADDHRWVPPHPLEELAVQQLKQLRTHFAEKRINAAGIEWFRQRTMSRRFRYSYLPWKLLGDLYRDAGLSLNAFEAYEQSLDRTLRMTSLSFEIKRRSFIELLNFCRDPELHQRGAALLERFAGDMSLSPFEQKRWMQSFGVSQKSTEPVPEREYTPRVAEGVTQPVPSRSPAQPEKSEAVEAWKNVNEATNRINRIRTITQYSQQADAVPQLARALESLFPTSFALFSTNIQAVLGLLGRYEKVLDRESKASLSRELDGQLSPLISLINGNNAADIKPYLQPLFEAFERIRSQLTVATGALPEPTIEALGRLNKFLPDEFVETSVLVRVENSSSEEMTGLNVSLTSFTTAIEILETGRPLENLSARSAVVLRYPVRRTELSGTDNFRVTVSYTVAGVQHSVFKDSPIESRSFAEFHNQRSPYFIPERYIVSLPVATDQVRNFYGRGEDQRRLLRSIEGGRLKKSVFINGIRRVGKTSLLASLPRVVPQELIPVLVDLRELDPGNRCNFVFLYHLARYVRNKIVIALQDIELHLPEQPEQAIFEAGPPDEVFVEFMKRLQSALGSRRILLLFDEIQYVTKSVANMQTRGVTDTVLNMLAAQCKPDGVFLPMFTASVRYTDIRKDCPHTLWGMVFPLDISFVSKEATSEILQRPVETDKVSYTPEALESAWTMTHGHPWITQAIGAEVLEILNSERRATVAPDDIIDAVDRLIEVDTYVSHWWNEQFLDSWDREVAFVLLDEKKAIRGPVPIVRLEEGLRKRAIPRPEQRIGKMCELEILVLNKDGKVDFKGEFLERWLSIEYNFVRSEHAPRPSTMNVRADCAMFIDHENLVIPLRAYVSNLAKGVNRLPYESRINPRHLAQVLVQQAMLRGNLKQKWVAADWQKIGGIRDYREAGIHVEQAMGKKDPTDHVLKEKIRDVLELFPEVSTYILVFGDEDYSTTIRTLLDRGKEVILWSCTEAFNREYLKLPIEVEYVEQFLFKDMSASESKAAASGRF